MKHYKIRQSITDRSSITMKLYLKEVNKQPLLSSAEELELAQKACTGDKEAIDRLVQCNLRFVISIAKQYQGQGLELPDLINEGNIGLMKAAEKFNPDLGFKFISYAVWWIRQNILQALAEDGKIVRIPLNQLSDLNKINKAITKFEQENERRPSYLELSDILDMEVDKIVETVNISNSAVSIDQPLDEDQEETLGDTLSLNEDSDNALIKSSLKKDIQLLLTDTLNEVELSVITKVFGINCTPMYLEDIADDLNITKERVRQIKDRAIIKLRKSDKIQLLTKYLG